MLPVIIRHIKNLLKCFKLFNDYYKIDDFNIEVKEVGDTVVKVLSNSEMKAKLRVIKIDSETKELLHTAIMNPSTHCVFGIALSFQPSLD